MEFRHDDLEQSFLDLGSGSGILAIAAARLGYSPVDAYDIDPEAVRVALENARKNRVTKILRIRRGDLAQLRPRANRRYDLVCANLIYDKARPAIRARDFDNFLATWCVGFGQRAEQEVERDNPAESER